MARKTKADWIKANPEKHRAWVEERRLRPDYFAKALIRRLSSRCSRNDVEFNLTVEDIVIPKKCPVLGIELKKTIGNGARTDNTPSIDRVDNDRGYVKDNIIIVSWRANRLKSDATPEELRRIAKFYGR